MVGETIGGYGTSKHFWKMGNSVEEELHSSDYVGRGYSKGSRCKPSTEHQRDGRLWLSLRCEWEGHQIQEGDLQVHI